MEIVNSIGMRLRYISPGTFLMGSSEDERSEVVARLSYPENGPLGGKWFRGESPQHIVEIPRAFFMGVFQVTQQQFKAVFGYHPSYYSGDGTQRTNARYVSPPRGGSDHVPHNTDTFPVENISWQESVEFCDRLSAIPEECRASRTYRLPTEAEWEYACRAGGNLPYSTGSQLTENDANFNLMRHSRSTKQVWHRRTCSVGSYLPNAFGLFDMHGNVSEWCADWFDADYYSISPQINPQGPLRGSLRVLRGGDYMCFAEHCRCACRDHFSPEGRQSNIGFRVACDLLLGS